MAANNHYDDIAKMIADENSPVGIDAKKTHILILQKLMQIEDRLENLENQQQNTEDKSS